MIILPRGSLSASTSRNTTGFLAGPEENSLAAAMAGELYLKRFFICNIAAQLTGRGGPRRPWCLQVTSHRATAARETNSDPTRQAQEEKKQLRLTQSPLCRCSLSKCVVGYHMSDILYLSDVITTTPSPWQLSDSTQEGQEMWLKASESKWTLCENVFPQIAVSKVSKINKLKHFKSLKSMKRRKKELLN